ncbi:MAG: hypothetical protein R6U50_10540 [Desulfobacterales bacterium]
MDEKEKFRVEVEAKLERMGLSLTDLTTKWETRKETRPDLRLQDLAEKQQQAQNMFEELKGAPDEHEFRKKQTDLKRMMSDIDEDIRQAWAYIMF